MQFNSSHLRMFLSVLALLISFSLSTLASEPIDPVQFAQRANTWKLRIEQIDASVRAPNIDDAGLAQQRRELERLSATIDEELKLQQPVISDLRESLSGLGAEPLPGAQAEPSAIASERRSLSDQISQLEGTIKVIALQRGQMTQIIRFISERRRTNFANSLFTRTSSPISLELWRDVRRSVHSEYVSLGGVLSSWFRFVAVPHPIRTLAALLLSICVAFIVYIVDRKVIASTLSRDLDRSSPSALRTSSSAIWMAVAPTLAVMIGAWLIYVIFDQFILLRAPLDQMLVAVLAATTGFIGANNLSRALLAPKRPAWRIFAISDIAAKRLRWLSLAIAAVYGGNYILGQLNIVLSANLPLTIARSAVSAVLIGILLAAVARTRLLDPASGVPPQRGGWPRLLYILLWAAVASLLASTLLGYIGLGGFLSTQVVITSAILLIAYTAYLVAKSLANPDEVINSFFARGLRGRFRTSDESIEQIGLVASFVLGSLVLLVCAPLILMQWGFQWEEIRLWIVSALTGFRVGNVEISLSTLLTGVFVFAVSLLLTRVLTNWLRERFISRTRIDEGLKNSISTGIGYVGFLISAALGITYAGLDLTNLALIAGALSVGIGFGLQNIVNNFVSGLIILVERPIKVGDWIGVGAYTGFVKRISVRATELETLDRQSVVVPNAELINTPVTNWMLKDKLGRISVKIGVAYSSNEEQVRDILLEIAKHHPQIATHPLPDVIFSGFGDSSLDFELRVFLKDVGKVITVSSDLRFAIRKALREAEIEIPFPQRDLHIKSTDATEALLARLTGKLHD